MNPLDAARRLATTDDRQVRSRYDGCTECVFCLVKEDRGHADDCPLLALPRIVAALEAAHAFLWAIDEDEGHGDELSRHLLNAAQDLEIALGDAADDEALIVALLSEQK